jgi:hypothetical protein
MRKIDFSLTILSRFFLLGRPSTLAKELCVDRRLIQHARDAA